MTVETEANTNRLSPIWNKLGLAVVDFIRTRQQPDVYSFRSQADGTDEEWQVNEFATLAALDMVEQDKLDRKDLFVVIRMALRAANVNHIFMLPDGDEMVELDDNMTEHDFDVASNDEAQEDPDYIQHDFDDDDEEADDLDQDDDMTEEVSKKTLGSYVKKAANDKLSKK